MTISFFSSNSEEYLTLRERYSPKRYTLITNIISISSGRLLHPVNQYMGSTSLGNTTLHLTQDYYIPRGRNELHKIFEHHFTDFCEQYDEKYAAKYGMFRLDRIQQVGEQFSTCGDYLKGIVRIRCTNPECGHDYFRSFSCKGFYLCPSCSLVVRSANCSALRPGQKRTLLFAELCVNHFYGSDAARHAETLAAEPAITAMQYTPEAGTPSALAKIDMPKMFQDAGKPVYINCPAGEVEGILDSLDPKGLAINPSGVETLEQADELMELIMKYSC